MSVQELAAKTAAEIRRRGWTTGTMADFTGGKTAVDCPVCLVGGISSAVFENPTMIGCDDDLDDLAGHDVVELIDTINSRTHHPTPSGGAISRVTSWNDTVAGSAEAVLALLDSIATS